MLTPTRAVQSFIDSKKEKKPVPEEVLRSIGNFRKWNEVELLGLKNASAYYPEIFIEPGMEEAIAELLQKFKDRIVPHKF